MAAYECGGLVRRLPAPPESETSRVITWIREWFNRGKPMTPEQEEAAYLALKDAFHECSTAVALEYEDQHVTTAPEPTDHQARRARD